MVPAKTTTTGSLAYFLSRGHRVLAVDLDSQGNLTELLTQCDIYDFHGETVLEAMKKMHGDISIGSMTSCTSLQLKICWLPFPGGIFGL